METAITGAISSLSASFITVMTAAATTLIVLAIGPAGFRLVVKLLNRVVGK